MKAKDQARHWQQSENPKLALQNIMAEYLSDFRTLFIARQISTAEGLFTLVEELNNKWKLFLECSGIKDPVEPSLFINRLKSFIKLVDINCYGLFLLMMKRYGNRFDQ